MDEILRTWPLVAAPTLLLCAVVLWGRRSLAAALDEIGGAIRSRPDLAPLRRAINVNMALAVTLWLSNCLYFATLYALRSRVRLSGYTFFAYVVSPLFASAICMWRCQWPVERRARELPVLCDDPEVEETYRRWLRQWREPRLRLPRD